MQKKIQVGLQQRADKTCIALENNKNNSYLPRASKMSIRYSQAASAQQA
jgi:hypothetical protein